jgi:hypothetical protein
MNALKSFLLVVLFLFAIIIGWVLIFDFSIQSSLLNVRYYTHEINKHKLYELPKNNVILQVKKNSHEDIPEPINTAINNALDKCFTPLWVESQAKKVLTNLFDYVKGKNNTPDLTINLTERKTLLEKNLKQELNELHPEELKVYNIKTSGNSELCKEIMALANLPDQVEYSSYLKNAEIQRVFIFSQKYYYYLMILPNFLLLLVFLLMYRIATIHSFLKWIGNSMIVAGILFVTAVFAFNGQIEQVLVNNIYYQVNPLHTIAVDPLILATVFKNDLAIVASIIAIIYCAVGICITLIGYYMDKKVNIAEYPDL